MSMVILNMTRISFKWLKESPRPGIMYGLVRLFRPSMVSISWPLRLAIEVDRNDIHITAAVRQVLSIIKSFGVHAIEEGK